MFIDKRVCGDPRPVRSDMSVFGSDCAPPEALTLTVTESYKHPAPPEQRQG